MAATGRRLHARLHELGVELADLGGRDQVDRKVADPFEQKLQLLLGDSGFSPREEEDLVASFLARRPDAIYLTGTTHSLGTRRMLEAARINRSRMASHFSQIVVPPACTMYSQLGIVSRSSSSIARSA